MVLEHSCVELEVLMQEEFHRAHAEVDKVPKDSIFKVRGHMSHWIVRITPILSSLMGHPHALQDTMGKGAGDGAMTGQFNWLCRSLIADNPTSVVAAAREVGCGPRKAVEVRLNQVVVLNHHISLLSIFLPLMSSVPFLHFR